METALPSLTFQRWNIQNEIQTTPKSRQMVWKRLLQCKIQREDTKRRGQTSKWVWVVKCWSILRLGEIRRRFCFEGLFLRLEGGLFLRLEEGLISRSEEDCLRLFREFVKRFYVECCFWDQKKVRFRRLFWDQKKVVWVMRANPFLERIMFDYNSFSNKYLANSSSFI